MAINWRQRAPVIRLLAAVYAELGEEAFKGRYGGIAKLYGPNATYDAIRSFFGKEVARTADQLKVQNPDYRGGSNARIRRRASTTLRRHPLVCLDDDEIIVVSEREIEGGAGDPNQAPEQVSRTAASEPPGDLENRAQSEMTLNETNPFRLPPPMSTAESSPKSGRQEPVNQVLNHERQQTSRKRPCSATQEPVDDQLERTSHAKDSPSCPTDSFGYVSNQGDYCCALCMSRLSSQQRLVQHESMSQLHLGNLKNLTVVSRGRAFLAQVTSLSNFGPRQPNLPNPGPLKLGGFERRNEVTTGGFRSSLDPLQDPSTHTTQRTGGQHESTNNGVSTLHQSSAPVSQLMGQGLIETNRALSPEIIETRRPDKGKRPAVDLPSGRPSAAAARRPQNAIAQSHPPPSHHQPTAISHSSAVTNPETAKNDPPYHHRDPQDTTINDQGQGREDHGESKRLVQTFLSAGMSLAKIFIDDHHPELVPHFYSWVQSEASSAAPATGSSSAAARPAPPPPPPLPP